ncbi:hypothetical protein [Tenacibaculum geojense]|uniref:Uncharacterized protein n=1 Tax=Tenacibaculum geojense TaxID=915352 RepID=A0ABW3JRP2_9FLAO
MCLVFYNNWEFYTTAIEIAVTIGLGIIVWYSTKKFNNNQLEIANHQLQKQLFSEFNQRYDVLNDHLEKICKFNSLEELQSKKPKKYNFLRNKLNDYFNLCAEEYYWFKKGRIDKDVWLSWEKGMNSWYANYPIIREAWEEEYNLFGATSFYLKPGENFFNS